MLKLTDSQQQWCRRRKTKADVVVDTAREDKLGIRRPNKVVDISRVSAEQLARHVLLAVHLCPAPVHARVCCRRTRPEEERVVVTAGADVLAIWRKAGGVYRSDVPLKACCVVAREMSRVDVRAIRVSCTY